MSHVVQIKTEVRDFAAVKRACLRLKLDEPVHGTFQLYGTTETGCGVKLRDWRYPVICKLETGELRYDNFGGRWGDARRLDEFLQGYAVERAKLVARKQGHSATEQQLADGSIKVTINVGANS
jgi:hypothetical protein